MVDANILIAGSVWFRFPYEVMRHALKKDYQLVLTPFIIAEVRKHLLKSFPENVPRFEQFLEDSSYEEIPTPTKEDIQAHHDLIRDPDDIAIALAAISAKVDFFITQDKDFTDQDESTEKIHSKLNIILPGTFLREQMGWTSEALEKISKRKNID
jgi:predicted nucleic acid-binding protein